jgi:hypothetical protein
MMSYRGKAPERAIILEGRILVWLEQRVAGEASADDAGGTGQHQFQTTGQKKERGGVNIQNLWSYNMYKPQTLMKLEQLKEIKDLICWYSTQAEAYISFVLVFKID